MNINKMVTMLYTTKEVVVAITLLKKAQVIMM
jgi:hypothetical protein